MGPVRRTLCTPDGDLETLTALKSTRAVSGQAAVMAAHVSHARVKPDPAAVVRGLRRRLAERGQEVQVIETHISWVLLAGHLVYKLKKPLELGFLDYGSLEARRRCCEEEVRLNRRLVPDLYLGVVAVRAGARGPALGGDGPVIDYAVKMRRLPPLALASERLARGELELAHLQRLAVRLAAFHEAAPVSDESRGTAEAVRADAMQVLESLAACGPPLDQDAVGMLRQWFQTEAAALAPTFARRRSEGRVRDGHGDLHLDNVVVLDDMVTAFDCIEFDPALRVIDVLSDAGFLVMDLLAHGRRDLAFGFLNAYLEAGGDYAGVAVLRFYIVYRALVRALVAALREQQRAQLPGLRSNDYLGLAQRLAAAAADAPGGVPTARLLITHGLPGSGKSHLSQQLLERAGAIRVRSDVERKRLAGLAPLAASRPAGVPDLYSPERNRATYECLQRAAEAALRAGYPTIVDAAFLRHGERRQMRALAAALQVPFAILDCRAPLALLRTRVRERTARGFDPSEADEAVLEHLARVAEPLDPGESECAIVVRTDEPLAVAQVLGRWMGQPVAIR